MGYEELTVITANPNLSEQVRHRLKEYILENKLRSGDKLPSEGTLAKRLGVSRTALREALSSLQAWGLLEARQGSGRVVSDFSFKSVIDNLSYGLAFHNHDILNMVEIRKALDSHFIVDSIRNISEEALNELADIVEQMQINESNGVGITDLDYRFHLMLYIAAGNPLALQLFEIAWAARRNTLTQDRVLKHVPDSSVMDHVVILRAIRARDVDGAREMILKHHQHTERLFRERIAQEAKLRQQAAAEKV